MWADVCLYVYCTHEYICFLCKNALRIPLQFSMYLCYNYWLLTVILCPFYIVDFRNINRAILLKILLPNIQKFKQTSEYIL